MKPLIFSFLILFDPTRLYPGTGRLDDPAAIVYYELSRQQLLALVFATLY
jgi:hypothetical protein